MSAAPKLTPARRRALATLVLADRQGRTLRISNETNDGCVYWQSAAWLQRENLAVSFWTPTAARIELTDAGRAAIGPGCGRRASAEAAARRQPESYSGGASRCCAAPNITSTCALLDGAQ